MGKGIPEIGPEERTPLVVQLLEIIQQQQEDIQRLRDEIAVLKGQKPRPKIEPSRLEQPAPQTPSEEEKQGKRPGSKKRSKNAELKIDNHVILFPDAPEGSIFLNYESYTVQELKIQTKVTRYWRARMKTPDGGTILAPLPDEVIAGSHFGPELISYCLYQYHHNHVTQPLLLEQLHEMGVDISSGQLNRILTEGKEVFHEEKDEVLQAGLQSSFIQVDDTGARHQGKNGYCLHIGNDLFAYFESCDSKSRLNFLEVLRHPHTDYVINQVAEAYWERQELSAQVITKLMQAAKEFADASAWHVCLQELGITSKRHVQIASEGALLGSLIAHGVSPELVVLSDGARQFDILLHAACWIHKERPLARMIPFSEPHRVAIEDIRKQIWELYQDLKAYRQQPDAAQVPILEARFDALVEQKTDFPSINTVLKDIREHKTDMLRVLQRPEVPLHNNVSESHVRDYVKKRKISGSTRSEAGRRCRDTFASLKKTCRCLGVRFWDYLIDRVRGLGKVARLADLIGQQLGKPPAPNGTAVPT